MKERRRKAKGEKGPANSWRGRKLVHVLASINYGGTESLCCSIVMFGRSEYGLQGNVVVLSAGEPEQMQAVERASGLGAEIPPFPPTKILRMLAWFVRYFLRVRPDGVIIYAFGLPHIVVSAAARIAGIRAIIVSAGNTAPGDRSSRRKWATIIYLSRLLRVRIASASQAISTSLEALGMTLPTGSRVIHNCCDVNRIAAIAARSRKKREAGGPLVAAMVARLDGIKDHAVLLEAWELLQHVFQAKDAELWIVGDGVLRCELEAKVHRLHLQGSVRFFGARKDVAEILGQIDVFVLATTAAEGFGIVLIEAMAASLPIIVTDVPACREVVGDAGILVQSNSAASLADALADLFGNAPRRTVLARSGYERAKSFFDAADTTRNYIELALPTT